MQRDSVGWACAGLSSDAQCKNVCFGSFKLRHLRFKAPVLGLYGGEDKGIPLTTLNQMKDALADAGANGNKAAQASEFVVYRAAPHAFHADYRPSYRMDAAEDGFAHALAWFKKHGVA